MAYGLKYTSSAYGLSDKQWKVELLEKDYSGSSVSLDLIGDGIKIGYDRDDDRFTNIYSRYAIIDLKVTENFNLDSLQFDDERKFQVKIYKDNALEFVGWLIPFYSSQAFEDTSIATISIQAKDGINQLKNIAFYNSNPTAVSLKRSFKDIICQATKQTGYDLNVDIYYNKYEANMSKTTSDCPLSQLYINLLTFSKSTNEWYSFYECLDRLLKVHNLRLFQSSGNWTIIDQIDLIEGIIYGRRFNSEGVYQSNLTLESDQVIHTGGLQVKNNTVIRKDIPYKRYSAFFEAGALSNLLKNGELTSFSGLSPNGWTKVGTWGYGDYAPNLVDGTTISGIKFQNQYTQSLNYNDDRYFESEKIDISEYNAFTLDFEAYADDTIDAIKIGIKLYDDTGISATEYFVDKNGIPRTDGRSAIIEKGLQNTFFKFSIECIISSATLYLGNITAMKIRIYPGFTYNTTPTNKVVKYRNIVLKAKEDKVSDFSGRYFQVTNTDLPQLSKNFETYNVYYADKVNFIKANYNNFLFFGDTETETTSWKRNSETESNTLIESVLKDKLAVTSTYNDIFEGSVFGYLDFKNTPIITSLNKRYLVLNSEYNLQENSTNLVLVELQANEIQYQTDIIDNYEGNKTVNATSTNGSFNLDSNRVNKYVREAGGNMYGELIVSGLIDAVPTTSTDPNATQKGILDIGTEYANTINFGNDLSLTNFLGDNLFDKGLIQLLENTEVGFSVVNSSLVEQNYFKLIDDTWITDTGFSGDYFDFNVATTAINEVGRLKWNDYDGTLDLGLKGGNVTLQIGQEQVIRVSNKTGIDLLESNYQAVRVSGVQGNRLKVDLAKADSDANSAETIGIVTETINNNNQGFITTSGLVRDINTTGTLQGETWADGDMLYLSPTTAGNLTNIKPQAPQHTVIMGYVVSAHQTQGQIFVKVDNGYELEELHNVKITSVANKDILSWNSTTNVWENLSLSEVGGIDGTGTANYITKWSDSDTIADSQLFDNGTNVGIGTNILFSIGKLVVSGASGTSVLSIERTNFASGGGLGAIAFKNTDSTSPFLSAITSTFGANSTSSYLSFRLGTASANPYLLTEIARISSSGNFIVGGTFTDLGTKFQVVGNSYFDGAIGINSSSLTGYVLRVSRNITGATVGYGIYQNGQVQSDVTSQVYGIANQLNTQSTTFTLATYSHFLATQGTIGSNSSITNQYGYLASSTIIGATNNYGFFSSIPTGSNNNWNFYASGTAPNYLAGRLGIGSTSITNRLLYVALNISGNATSYGLDLVSTINTDVTSTAVGFRSNLGTQASTSITSIIYYQASQGTFGSGSAVTNQYGFFVSNNLLGATNNYAFSGGITSGINNWNLYMSGTAKNYLNGSLLIGTTTDSGYKLDVTGTARFTGAVLFDAIPSTPIAPTSANHLVNKTYVDSLSFIKRGENVRTVSLPSPNGNITLSGTPTINGVSLVAGDLILVTGQTNQTTNGVYVIPAGGGAWTRSTNADSDAEIRGAYHLVTAGTYANSRYINTNTSTITIGTTAITYALDFGAETDPIFTTWRDTSRTARTVYIAGSSDSVPTWRTLTTSDISDLSSYASFSSYYTKTELDTSLAGKEPTITSGTTLQYWRGDKTWQTLNTASVVESTNLYFTESRVLNTLLTGFTTVTSATIVATDTILVAFQKIQAQLDSKISANQTITLSGDVSGSSATSISTTVNAIKNKTIPTLASGVLRYDGTNFVFDNAFIKLTNLSSSATGLTYTNTTGVFSLTTGYSIPLIATQTNWTTAYNRSITTISISGTTTKTLTLTKQDGTTLTASYTDLDSVTSVFGRTGAIVATKGDYTLNLLGDVTITTPSNNQALIYNGTTWVNSSIINSIAISVPTGLTVTNSPLTSSGTIGIAFATGYSIPTTAKQTEWDTAYTNRISSASSPLIFTSNVLSISKANSTTDGYLSKTDWATFNSKQNSLTLGNLTESTSNILTIIGGTNAIIGSGLSIQVKKADSLTNGYLSSTDFVTFTTAYNDRYKWDGSASVLNATTGRTSLGATTVGSNIFTLPNVSQISFIRINANNTISTLSASDFRTAIGAGTSNTDGTVTSVSMTVPTGLTISGSPITTSGTLALTFTTGYSIPTTTLQNQWSVAYTNRINTATTPLVFTSNTLSINQANSGQSGFLSSTDWNTFNNKQNALTNPITGTGTLNYLSKFSATTGLTNSQLFDNGTNIGIGTTTPASKLHIVGSLLLQSSFYIDFSINQTDSAKMVLGIVSGTNETIINTVNNETEHISGISKFKLLFNGTEKFRFTSDGKLGIGNNNPNNALDIAGDLNLTGKIKIKGSTGTDHQFIKFDGTNTVWAKINTGELEDGDDLVKYVLDNGEKGIKFYSGDSTASVKDTMGFIFTNEDTGIFGLHGFRLNNGNIEQYGLHIDQDTNLYRLKADGKRVRLLTTEDSIGSGTGGTSYTFASPLILSNNKVEIQKASSTTDGYLSADDWNMFKNISSTGVNFTANTPLSLVNGVLSIQQATSNQAGYITKDDYVSFSEKIGGSGGTINGGNLIMKGTSLGFMSNSGLTVGMLTNVGDNTLIMYNNRSNSSEILIQSTSGTTGGSIKMDTNNFYIGGTSGLVKIDMSGFGVGKVLKATASNKAEWVTI